MATDMLQLIWGASAGADQLLMVCRQDCAQMLECLFVLVGSDPWWSAWLCCSECLEMLECLFVAGSSATCHLLPLYSLHAVEEQRVLGGWCCTTVAILPFTGLHQLPCAKQSCAQENAASDLLSCVPSMTAPWKPRALSAGALCCEGWVLVV